MDIWVQLWLFAAVPFFLALAIRLIFKVKLTRNGFVRRRW